MHRYINICIIKAGTTTSVPGPIPSEDLNNKYKQKTSVLMNITKMF